MFHLKSTDVGNFKNGFLFCIEIFLTNLLEGKKQLPWEQFLQRFEISRAFSTCVARRKVREILNM